MPFFLSVIPWMETHCLWTSKTVRKFYFMCVEGHLKQKVQHTQKLLRRRGVAKGWCNVGGALDGRERCKAWKLNLQAEARSGRPWMPKWWSLGIITRHWGPVEEFLSENTSAGKVWLLLGMAQSSIQFLSLPFSWLCFIIRSHVTRWLQQFQPFHLLSNPSLGRRRHSIFLKFTETD